MSAGDGSTSVFVYGTLRRGERNHELLLGTSRMIGLARTPPTYTLVDIGRRPGLLDGGTSSVVGELYVVDTKTLEALDTLERHPNWYRRQTIHLGNGHLAEAYILPPQFAVDGRPIPSGDWSNR